MAFISSFARSTSVNGDGIVRSGNYTTLFDGQTLDADDLYIWSNLGTGTGTWAENKFGLSY